MIRAGLSGQSVVVEAFERADDQRGDGRVLSWWTLFLMALASVHFGMVMSKHGAHAIDMTDYLAGQLATPYQWRCLMMPVYETLLHLLDPRVIDLLPSRTPPYLKDPLRLSYLIVNASGMFFALVFHALAAHTIFRSIPLARFSTAILLAAAYVVFAGNPNLGYMLPYDLPSLAFFAMLLWLVLERRHGLACLIFPFAVLNRETVFVIPMLSLCCAFASGGNRADWRWSVILALEWLIVKLILFVVFAGNAEASEYKLPDNLKTIVQPWQWPPLLPIALLSWCCVRCATMPGKTGAIGTSGVVAFLALFVVAAVVETRAFGDLLHLQAMCATFLINQRLMRGSDTPATWGVHA